MDVLYIFLSENSIFCRDLIIKNPLHGKYIKEMYLSDRYYYINK